MSETFQKCSIAFAFLGAGYTISISTVVVFIQILSLLVGITVGCLSGYSIWLSIKRKRRDWNKQQILDKEDQTTTV
jgi:hypothetical protein